MRLFASFKAIEVYVTIVGILCLYGIDRLCELQEISLDGSDSLTEQSYGSLRSVDLFVKDRRQQGNDIETTIPVTATTEAVVSTSSDVVTTTALESTSTLKTSSESKSTTEATTASKETVTSTPAAETTTKAPSTVAPKIETTSDSVSSTVTPTTKKSTPSLGPGTPLSTDSSTVSTIVTETPKTEGGIWNTLTNIFEKRRKRENTLHRQRELNQKTEESKHEHHKQHEHQQHEHQDAHQNAHQHAHQHAHEQVPEHKHENEHEHNHNVDNVQDVTKSSESPPSLKDIPVIDQKYGNKTVLGVYRCELTDEFFLDAFLLSSNAPFFQRVGALRYWGIILLGIHLIVIIYHGFLNVSHRVPTSRRTNRIFNIIGLVLWSIVMSVIMFFICSWKTLYINQPITPEFPFLLYTFCTLWAMMMITLLTELLNPSMFWWSFDVLPRTPRLGYIPAAQSENAYIDGIIRRLETTDSMEITVDTNKPIIRQYQ